jgi:multicomponent Na+:H+ antiporter subunit D
MAVVYIWRIIEAAWFEPEAETATVIREAPVTMLIVTWVAALSNIYFGLVTELPRDLAAGAAESLLWPLP